jgi:transposase
MNYVGIDWAYRRAAWCALDEKGAIEGEGMIPADEDGLAHLVLELGTEVKACVETMSGTIWVKDQLEAAGWSVDVAHAGKVRDIAPVACKTDKVDARVLAELCWRDLVPAVWVASLEDRAIRERLRRRAHLVKLRTSHRNRIFGLLTQFGLRISFTRLRQPDALELLERRGVPCVWRDSIAEHLDQIDELQRRIRPIDSELQPIARSDPRAKLLSTIPGVGPLISLTFATEIGEVSRFSSAAKPVGYAGPGAADHPVGRAFGDRATLEGRIAHPSLGRGRGRQPGLEADQPLPRALPAARREPWHQPGEGLGRPQDLDLLLAHALARSGLPARSINDCPGKLPPLSGRLTVPHGIETPRQLPGTLCAESAEREMSPTHRPGSEGRR